MSWLSYRRLSAGNDDDMRVIMMSRLGCKCCCLAVFYPMVARRRDARRGCCTLVFLYHVGEEVWERLSFIVHVWVCHISYLSIKTVLGRNSELAVLFIYFYFSREREVCQQRAIFLVHNPLVSIASHVDAFSCCLVIPFFVDLFFLNIYSC